MKTAMHDYEKKLAGKDVQGYGVQIVVNLEHEIWILVGNVVT